jgi:N-acyl-D-amino-acid deacylase
MFDILIQGGRIIDGTGNPWYHGDVGIIGDRVAAISRLAAANSRHLIDATDRVVAPGFVDTHVHGDLALLADPPHEPAIRQGVTTYVLGQDGVAMAPSSQPTRDFMARYTAGFSGGAMWAQQLPQKPFLSMADYLAHFDRKCALNVCSLAPNGNVRMDVMDLDTRRASDKELAAMGQIVREAMQQGAVGLSSGLDYIPSRYADTDELISLCQEIAPLAGIYVTHMRGYQPDTVIAAMDEVERIGREAGCAVHISHLNCLAEQVLPKIDQMRAGGVDVTFDLYCYLAGSTILAMIALPPWVQEGGIDATLDRLWDADVRMRLMEWFRDYPRPLGQVKLTYAAAPEYKQHEGKTLDQAAKDAKLELGIFVCDILAESRLAVGCITGHHPKRTDADIRALMRHPAMMAGSDGIYTGSYPHPRGCGCFAKYLGHYVRTGAWTLEECVQKLAAHGARRYGLRDRGVLREKAFADVVVFDPKWVEDRSTYEAGRELAVGMEHVIVNGEMVLHNGQRTRALPGRALKMHG